MKPWDEIKGQVKKLLFEKELADMAPGQRWITVTPDGDVYLSATFSGDNSYVPGDDRIQLLRSDARESDCLGGFEFEADASGLVLLHEYWESPMAFGDETARDEWENEQRAEGRETGERHKIIGLTSEAEAELMDLAEVEYEQAIEERGGK